ncbi:hypothetical protein Tco_1219360 [Tanacetum coccineum]
MDLFRTCNNSVSDLDRRVNISISCVSDLPSRLIGMAGCCLEADCIWDSRVLSLFLFMVLKRALFRSNSSRSTLSVELMEFLILALDSGHRQHSLLGGKQPVPEVQAIQVYIGFMTVKFGTDTYFVEYTGLEYEERVNKKTDAEQECDDEISRPIYDEEPWLKYPETCQLKVMLDSSPDNRQLEYAKQSSSHENILLKRQGQHGQILNETSNKAKIKKEIDVLETMNIELEHSVAKLRKENETLKKHYKDLYDSIKITRSKTIEQTTSLLANNADLKAQIQEKVFAIAALKNDLRKLKGNSVDTKFAKTSVLGKPVLQSLRNQSVVRQPNAFKSERPQMSKQRFASQVDVNNNLSRPLGKRHKEKIGTQKTSVMPSARFQSTADGSKPKPMSTNNSTRSLLVSKSICIMITAVPKVDHSKSSSSFSYSKHFVCSTCHKCVFNANHDACITKLLKEVNSHAKIQSHKTRNSNKPIDQKSHTQKLSRQVFTRHRFSPNKTSVVYEKTSPRSNLRWKPTCRIFRTIGLRWVPTGKILASCTSKNDSEPTHGSNIDISKIQECKQTLNLSASTSLNGQKKQRIDLSAVALYNVKQENLRVWLLKTLISQKPVSQRGCTDDSTVK